MIFWLLDHRSPKMCGKKFLTEKIAQDNAMSSNKLGILSTSTNTQNRDHKHKKRKWSHL